MGYRMQGQVLERTESREMFSHGLLPGVVQVPHNGQPIVLMNDAQTTGGYPKIATIVSAHLDGFAQLRPHDAVRFRAVSPAEAVALARLPGPVATTPDS